MSLASLGQQAMTRLEGNVFTSPASEHSMLCTQIYEGLQ